MATVSSPAKRAPASATHTYRGVVLTVTRGRPIPLGAGSASGGVNFAVICRHATAISLVLSEPCSGAIEAEIPLDPRPGTGRGTTGTSR